MKPLAQVVWSEGMLIRPQHFQQQEHYLTELSLAPFRQCHHLQWGWSDLRLNPHGLAKGEFSIEQASGVMPDAMPFEYDRQRDGVVALKINPGETGVIYWVLPQLSSLADADMSHYAFFEQAFSDPGHPDQTASIQLSRPKPRLCFEADIDQNERALPLVKILECRQNGSVLMDENFIPPLALVTASRVLSGYLDELVGLITQRRQMLLNRLEGVDPYAVSGIADWLLLKLLNHYEPLFSHFQHLPSVTPHDIYLQLLSFCGELSTFTQSERCFTNPPAYRHDHLDESFTPLMVRLRADLNQVLDEPAVHIPLQKNRHGVYLATIPMTVLTGYRHFILGVKAAVASETLAQHFPPRSKLGPLEQIRDLVNLQLPGINLRALPAAPPQIPFHADTLYFALENQGSLWDALAESQGLAIHIAGQFPELTLQLWASQ